MPVFNVEVEIKVEAESAEEASEIVMYGAIRQGRGIIDYGVTCEPYEV
jgi:hypothetical protein